MAKNRRGINGVDREQKEFSLGRKKVAAGPQQGGEIAFDFPEFAIGTAAKGWRVEHDSLVLIAPLYFTFHERHRIFDDPADGGFGHAGEFLIAATPSHGGFGSIDVGDVPAGLSGDQRGRSRVAKKIKQAWALFASLFLLRNPFPVGRLFGKDPELLRIVHEP